MHRDDDVTGGIMLRDGGAAGMLFSVFLYLFSRFSFISYVQFSSSRTGHQLLSIKVKKIVRRAYVRAG